MGVLVTGGTGFLGSHLVDRLLENPDTEVYVLVRKPGRARHLVGRDNVVCLEGSLLNVPQLPAGLSVVYHLAGITKASKSSDYYSGNRDGTASLFRALARGDGSPRIVHVSSLAAAGPSSPGRPVREDDPPRPVSPYGRSKLAAEGEALAWKDRFPLVILRPAAVYGPRDQDFLKFFRLVSRGIIPLYGRGSKSLSLCSVRDVVRAILMAAGADVASGEVFNIAHSLPATWEEIGKAAAAILGRRTVRVRVPPWGAFLVSAASGGIGRLSGRPAALNLGKFQEMRPAAWEADIQKARDILRFEARVSLEDGLRETLDWYLQNNLL
jgi:dihydroflavonol-4-reductase